MYGCSNMGIEQREAPAPWRGEPLAMRIRQWPIKTLNTWAL